ncbi:MAG: hypothetical protein JWN49_357 [Parcubacteria group bacterium]|nr:hypothetical protein [Parcubacteria group bacterium]
METFTGNGFDAVDQLSQMRALSYLAVAKIVHEVSQSFQTQNIEPQEDHFLVVRMIAENAIKHWFPNHPFTAWKKPESLYFDDIEEQMLWVCARLSADLYRDWMAIAGQLRPLAEAASISNRKFVGIFRKLYQSNIAMSGVVHGKMSNWLSHQNLPDTAERTKIIKDWYQQLTFASACVCRIMALVIARKAWRSESRTTRILLALGISREEQINKRREELIKMLEDRHVLLALTCRV